MKVEQARRYDDDLLAGVNALLPQLSSSSHLLDHSELRAVLDSETTHLFIALDETKICGMLTLVVFRIPTGVRSRIEDVVVSESSRGKGVGKAMLIVAIQFALEQGAKTLDLTSGPAKEAANRLYQKAGFEQRETNVYRLVF